MLWYGIPHFRFGFAKRYHASCVLKHDYISWDDVIKWKHFPRYWPSVRGIHRSPVTSPHKGQWRGALMFFLNWAWINGWVNNCEAGDLRHHLANYDVTVMWKDVNFRGFRCVLVDNARQHDYDVLKIGIRVLVRRHRDMDSALREFFCILH